MELFISGHQAHAHAHDEGGGTGAARIKAKYIKVVWSSWCDAVIVVTRASSSSSSSDQPQIQYLGTGLTPRQAHHLCTSAHLLSALLNGKDTSVNFFGSAMHDGLRGYVVSHHPQSKHEEKKDSIVLFATDVEIDADGEEEIQEYNSTSSEFKISDIKFLSTGNVQLSTLHKIIQLKDLAALRTHLDSTTPPAAAAAAPAPAPALPPHQWCTNATTSTTLLPNAKVYTSTSDPRYPKCLGRPYDSNNNNNNNNNNNKQNTTNTNQNTITSEPTFSPLPYLSETPIAKIASGGYVTAALSEDGELYLWGQACPGAQGGKLAVLEGEEEEEEEEEEGGRPGMEGGGGTESCRATTTTTTGISVEGEQDEFVQCLRVMIQGQEARVYDVAVGHGHVVVAAEVVMVEPKGRVGKRTVFVAGDNSRGQLGPGIAKGFRSHFEEVVALRDKRVMQLAAAGWTTLVVTKAHHEEEQIGRTKTEV